MGFRRSSSHADGRWGLWFDRVFTSDLPLHPVPKQGILLVANDQRKAFSPYTLSAVSAAKTAGTILRQGYGKHFSISHKEGEHNLVTEYDRRSEEAILDLLSKEFPESSFLAEESGASGKKGTLLWVVDPLDGTVNFAHQIPVFCVSIGLEKEGFLFSAVVYQPMTEELFVAERGRGAFLNEKPIRVSSVARLKDAFLTTGFPYNTKENPHHCIDRFVAILKAGVPTRRLGAAALELAYTAAGRCDGFFEAGLGPWDCAAGALLIEEAGGQVSDWEGNPYPLKATPPIVATNQKIHQELVDSLRDHKVS